jgi:hypothetical protein
MSILACELLGWWKIAVLLSMALGIKDPEGAGPRRRRLLEVLEADIWPTVPAEVRGRRLSKADEEDILGIGEEQVNQHLT